MRGSRLETINHFHLAEGRHSVIYITLFFLLSLSLLIPARALSISTFKYETTLRLTAGPVGKTRPTSVTIDPIQGEVCITDERQASLHVLNNADIELFRTSTIAQLSYPGDGCIDQLGRLVCVDRAGAGVFTIRRLNVYGEPDLFTPEQPCLNWIPTHLIITRDGNYLTLDSRNAVLAKHDCRDGHLIWQRTIAETGSDDLHLGRPAEAPNGQLYIPGGNLRRVLVLDSNGYLNTSFGEFGSAQGYFSLPVAASFTPQGGLIILDRMRHKLMVFQPQYELISDLPNEMENSEQFSQPVSLVLGRMLQRIMSYKYEHRFVSEFGSMGSAPGQFYHPVAIAADKGGRVYVTQGFQGRVQVFRYTADESGQSRPSLLNAGGM